MRFQQNFRILVQDVDGTLTQSLHALDGGHTNPEKFVHVIREDSEKNECVQSAALFYLPLPEVPCH